MPSLPSNPMLPQHPQGGTPETKTWSGNFTHTLGRIWSELVFTVNTLCRVDTLANRRTTPQLNESFFAASNTRQLFVGVAGTWENVGPRRALATIANTATSVTVTLTPAEPDTSYLVVATAEDNLGAIWITSKLAGSFVINSAVAAGVGGDTVGWTLWRTASG